MYGIVWWGWCVCLSTDKERSHIEGLANTFDLLNSYIETADLKQVFG